jgi:hypothetical protein
MSNAAQAPDAIRPRLNRQARRAHHHRSNLAVARAEVGNDASLVDQAYVLPPLADVADTLLVRPEQRSSGVAPGAALPHIAPLEDVHLAGLDHMQPPVAYYRAFVDLMGGVKGAVWLSHAYGIHNSPACGTDGWFFYDVKDCTALCGLSLKEYATARAAAKARGFVESRRFGTPGGRVQFRLHMDVISQALLLLARKTWAPTLAKAATTTRTA